MQEKLVIPIKRYKPEQIVTMRDSPGVLVPERASYITGQTVMVDGGIYKGL